MKERSFRFTHTVSRLPGKSIANGLRAHRQPNPDHENFLREHVAYINALEIAGVETLVLPALENYPDSVFVEDAALCFGNQASILRPGAASRFGEAAAISPDLLKLFGNISNLDNDGFVDGGDILLTDDEALIGLSERTDQKGVDALTPHLQKHGYKPRIVNTPKGVLHFKSDCSLLDSETIFSTKALAESGCFENYKVVLTPTGEEAAANLIRVNDYVIMRTGFPKTKTLLERHGYQVMVVNAEEAAKVDGGLSCMSLRFALN